MTLTLKLSNKAQIKDFKLYLKELYEYIGLDEDEIPASISIIDTSVTIYMTDEFFQYAYQYFLDIVVMGTKSDNKDPKLEILAENFREGAYNLLMKKLAL